MMLLISVRDVQTLGANCTLVLELFKMGITNHNVVSKILGIDRTTAWRLQKQLKEVGLI